MLGERTQAQWVYFQKEDPDSYDTLIEEVQALAEKGRKLKQERQARIRPSSGKDHSKSGSPLPDYNQISFRVSE